MKRLTEDEMAARYPQPDVRDESTDEQLTAMIKALPEPGLPARFVQNTTERLLLAHQQRMRRRRFTRWLVASAMLIPVTVLGIVGYFSSLPMREVVAAIIHYKWECVFAMITIAVCQYIDGRLVEEQLRKVPHA